MVRLKACAGNRMDKVSMDSILLEDLVVMSNYTARYRQGARILQEVINYAWEYDFHKERWEPGAKVPMAKKISLAPFLSLMEQLVRIQTPSRDELLSIIEFLGPTGPVREERRKGHYLTMD